MAWTNILDIPGVVSITGADDFVVADRALTTTGPASGAETQLYLNFETLPSPVFLRIHAELVGGSSPYGYRVAAPSCSPIYVCGWYIGDYGDASADLPSREVASGVSVGVGDGDGAHWHEGSVSLWIEIDYAAPPPSLFWTRNVTCREVL